MRFVIHWLEHAEQRYGSLKHFENLQNATDRKTAEEYSCSSLQLHKYARPFTATIGNWPESTKLASKCFEKV